MAAEPKCDFGREIGVKLLYIQEQLDKLNGRMWKLIFSLATMAGGAIVALIVVVASRR